MKIAFMFSGQGAQYPGMGKDLYDKYLYVKNIFEEANRILGYDIADIMFNNEEKLNETLYTQAAMFVLYQSVLKVLDEHEIRSDYSFGLSLGEYGAYLHNNVFDFETGLKIIQKRGEAMNEAAYTSPGKMSAILGMEADVLKELISKTHGYVKIANYNTYGQLVVSGEEKAIEELNALAKEAGAKRTITLNTSGAFHCDLMLQAALKFREDLKEFKLNRPDKNLLVNVTGDYFSGDISDTMVRQITSSVRLYQTIEKLIKDGIDTFIEIGPKTTLCGFVKKIDRDVLALNVENIQSLEKTLTALEERR